MKNSKINLIPQTSLFRFKVRKGYKKLKLICKTNLKVSGYPQLSKLQTLKFLIAPSNFLKTGVVESSSELDFEFKIVPGDLVRSKPNYSHSCGTYKVEKIKTLGELKQEDLERTAKGDHPKFFFLIQNLQSSALSYGDDRRMALLKSTAKSSEDKGSWVAANTLIVVDEQA